MGKETLKKYEKLLKENCTCQKSHLDCSCKFPEIVQEKIEGYNSILETYNTHVSQKNHQNKSIEDLKKNLKVGEGILIGDFKQNVQLKESQRQIGRDFYGKPQRSVFDWVLLYRKDEKDTELTVCPFDYISTCLAHNGSFVKASLEKLFQHTSFTDLNLHSLYFWMDGGKHFKNYEIANAMYELFQKQDWQKFEWNFFVENHGKNDCDVRFSTLSKFLSDYTNIPGQDVNDEHDLIKAIQHQQNLSNQYRMRKGERAILA
jgi:hypothetical protein